MSDDFAVEALQAAVRIQTVSHRDRAQNDSQAFDDFIEELAARFPLLHNACEVKRLAGNALLLRWPAGSSADALQPVVLMAHIDVVPIDPDDNWPIHRSTPCSPAARYGAEERWTARVP